MKDQYTVFVDDNYHPMDGSERYAAGSYASLEEAVNNCKKITISSLRDLYEEEITPEELIAQWAMFGEDPYVFGGAGGVPFSARKFISTELCKEIIDSVENEIAKPEA